MKTIILRLLQVVLLAVLVIIGVNVLEPLRPVKLSEEKQAAAEETVREIKESANDRGGKGIAGLCHL